MTGENELYLAFAKLYIGEAVKVLASIIEGENKQGYESTTDLVRIEELRDLRSKLKYEVLGKLRQMQQ